MKNSIFGGILSQENGSIAPLGIGMFLFSLIFSLTSVSATSMFIFQKKLTSLAESTAIYVASGNGNADDFFTAIGNPNLQGLKVSSSLDSDEVTVVAKVCALWIAPVVTVGEFARREICTHASARAAN